jgi:hypothetical protein
MSRVSSASGDAVRGAGRERLMRCIVVLGAA